LHHGGSERERDAAPPGFLVGEKVGSNERLAVTGTGGMFWAGIGSTFVMGLGTAITVAIIATLAVGAKAIAKRFVSMRGGYGAVLLRGIEAGAAALVLIFGVLLLAGYMASERLAGI
jgi:ABC-type nickel/cobalt efflux system permease component RcnA